MRKITNIVVVIAFVAILLIPLLSTNRNPEAVSTTDNRELAMNPIHASLQGTRLAVAIDNYFNDRIGLRENFIDFNGRISYSVFKESPVERVIVGKDGWLFYNGEKCGDGRPISQYLGIHKYTDEELQTMANNLVRTRDYLAERDCEFVLYIAPNKERVYSQFIPDMYQNIRTSETCGTEQIVNYLRENTDIRVVWPYEDLTSYMEQHPDEPLYYELDTHWNNLGAYIGAKSLLDELNCSFKIPEPEEIDRTCLETVNSGDLRNMMAVGDWLSMDGTEWEINGFPSETTVVEEGDYTGHWLYHNEDKDSRTLLLTRDSFTTAMRLVLGSAFNEVDLCHLASYAPELIEEVKPDIFVYETVERYADNLLGLNIIPAE